MTYLIGGDCLDILDTFEPNSIDLIFCDLPYGQTSCKWDCLIDLDILWKQFMKIKKLNTPIIMTCTTKFGVNLINSAPKQCPFRYDLVWCKSAPCGFLSAKKMPMRKHEMIYVFYEKLPFYDISSHKHKFIKERGTEQKNGKIYEGEGNNKKIMEGKYEPPLPTLLIKQDVYEKNKTNDDLRKDHRNKQYDPPLPTSLVKECEMVKDFTPNKNGNIYDCPDNQEFKGRNGKPRYEPPLPTSLIKEDNEPDLYGYHKNQEKHKEYLKNRGFKDSQVLYEPPLPNSLLEIKSTKGKHSTEKPVELMKWILKYYSKEGDIVLDPTMGSGSMGVACEEMKRNFIGIEKDEEIFGVAWERLNP